MDPDGKQIKIIKRKRKEDNFLQGYVSYVRDVFSSIWVRRTVQTNNGFKWIILGCRHNFLFNFRLFLCLIYITYEIFK